MVPSTPDDGEKVSLLDLGTDKPDLGDGDTDTDRLKGKDINQVSAKNRKMICRNRIRRAVRKHGEQDGVTISELEKATRLNRTTIRNHLDALCKLREVYRRERGNTHIYYPNGRPLHSFGKERVESGDTILEVQLAEGRHGRYCVHITEKRFSLTEGETTEGGIMFELDQVDDLVDVLRQYQLEAENS